MAQEELPPMEPPEELQRLVLEMGGTIKECVALPDGSGAAVMSYPLPKDHWSRQRPAEYEAPPMTLRDLWMDHHPDIRATVRRAYADKIRAAIQYAYRVSIDYGAEPDLDPDALVQNLIVGLLGYWTDDGLSPEPWANPPDLRR